jgi:hypothetical protein
VSPGDTFFAEAGEAEEAEEAEEVEEAGASRFRFFFFFLPASSSSSLDFRSSAGPLASLAFLAALRLLSSALSSLRRDLSPPSREPAAFFALSAFSSFLSAFERTPIACVEQVRFRVGLDKRYPILLVLRSQILWQIHMQAASGSEVLIGAHPSGPLLDPPDPLSPHN